ESPENRHRCRLGIAGALRYSLVPLAISPDSAALRSLTRLSALRETGIVSWAAPVVGWTYRYGA
ncbi:hypothetical protein, partial [Acidithiobacillus caldus]|uniref:hypothetical protein n=1 Tax=Acidithiobacillus caldus TaxID=33059 RepID=UPI001A7E0570